MSWKTATATQQPSYRYSVISTYKRRKYALPSWEILALSEKLPRS